MSPETNATSFDPKDATADEVAAQRSRRRRLFIVSCTRGRKEETDLYRSLQKLGIENFLFFENNTRGLPYCYNSVLDERAGRDEIIVFAHDDVTIGDTFFKEKLNEASCKYDFAITGVAGTAAFAIDPSLPLTKWGCIPCDAWSGWVEHCSPKGPPILFNFGPAFRHCNVLDGLLLAVDITKAGHIRFDEQFAFHFYDLDFCLTAYEEKLTLGTSNIYLTHRSPRGDYLSQDYKHAQDKFHAKWLPRQDARNELLLKKWQEAIEQLPLCLPASAWVGHVPFLYLLFKLTEPRTYVELGVDLGTSFLSACDATDRFRTGTRCYGIDTWQGDQHSGLINGNAVFGPLQKFVAARYPHCKLFRQTFDQTVEYFDDGSIDLLHIDGLHTYEAVLHDFSTWLPKLSDRSVVLFHDTEVRERDFGVYKFWSEVKAKYRHFEFTHSFGLGVLLTGASVSREFEELVGLMSADGKLALAVRQMCSTAARDLQRRLLERGPPKISELALMHGLVLDKSNLGVSHEAPGQNDLHRGLRRNDLCYCGSGRRFKHCHGKLV
jgi:hypothetical protein